MILKSNLIFILFLLKINIGSTLSTDTHQTVNIALNQVCYSSSEDGNLKRKQLALDGSFNQAVCFSSTINPMENEWWMVVFSNSYFIRTIRILNTRGHSMSNVLFFTSINDTDPNNINSFTLCNRGSVGSMQSLTVDCLNGPQYSKLAAVKLELINKKLIICEIEIWTMRDIDRNKFNILSPGETKYSANDGQSFSKWEAPHCSWTGSIVPSWWAIDLEIKSEIYAVSLVNRIDPVVRLSRVKIIISNNQFTNPPWQPEILCNTINDATYYMTRRCPKYTIGRYLALFKTESIPHPGNALQENLSLIEVKTSAKLNFYDHRQKKLSDYVRGSNNVLVTSFPYQKATSAEVFKLKQKIKTLLQEEKIGKGFTTLKQIIEHCPVDSFLKKNNEILGTRSIREEILNFTYEYKKISIDDGDIEDVSLNMYRFPYFKALDFIEKIGTFILIKTIFYKEYYIVNGQWLMSIFHQLQTSSEQCQGSLKGQYYFLTKDTPVCRNMEKAFMTTLPSHLVPFPIRRNSMIFCQMGIVLDLTPNSCVFPQSLPKPETPYKSSLNLKEAVSAVLMYHPESPIYMNQLHRLVLYLITSVYKIGDPFGSIIELRRGRVVLQGGPVETCILFDDEEEEEKEEGSSKTIKVISSTLACKQAPALIAGFLIEIAVIIEFALHESSIFYERQLETPWGNEANFEDDSNLLFFDNFNIFYTPIDALTEKNALRSHLIWIMHKQYNPTTADEIYFTEEHKPEEMLTLSTLSNDLDEDPQIKPSNVTNSIQLISEKNQLQFLFDTINHKYEIIWKYENKSIQRKMYFADLSILKIQLLFKYHGKKQLHFKNDEIEMKIYLDNIVTDCINVPKDNYQLVIQTREDLAQDSDIDFTFAPKDNYKLSRDKIKIGQKFQIMAETDDKSMKPTIATICDISHRLEMLKISHCWLKQKYKWINLQSLTLLLLKKNYENIRIETNNREFNWEELMEYLDTEQIPQEVVKKLHKPNMDKIEFSELVTQHHKGNENYYGDFFRKLEANFLRYFHQPLKDFPVKVGFLMKCPLRDTSVTFLSEIIENKTFIPYAFCRNLNSTHIIKTSNEPQKFIPELECISALMLCSWINFDKIAEYCTCENAQLLLYSSYLRLKYENNNMNETKLSKPLIAKWKTCFIDFLKSEKFIKNKDNGITICNFHNHLNEKFENVGKEEIEIFVNSSIVKLELQGINLENIPQEFSLLSPTIANLQITECDLKSFPQMFCDFKQLQCLNLSSLPIDSLPDEFGELINLEELIISQNVFKEFPSVIFQLSHLIILKFNAFGYTPKKINTSILTDDVRHQADKQWEHLENFGLDKNILENLIKETALQNSSAWTLEEFQHFSSGLYFKLPRISAIDFNLCPNNEICENLTVLELKYQSFKIIDNSIKYLIKLQTLDLSFNLLLEEISAEICHLPLKNLKINDCPALKTPPREIVKKGLNDTMGYMKRLSQGSTQCRRSKLMLVGLGGAGKTSLIKKMMTMKNEDENQDSIKTIVTDGITIKNWSVQSVEYSIWDFAGQTVYYNTHQFFLSNRAVYFLLWNVRLGHEHAGLEFWLSSIECHAPKAPIFVVGSHIDQVNKAELTIRHYQRRYPQIKGFHNISSKTGQGINDLVDNMVKVTLQQQYMNEKIPKTWLNFENKIIEYRTFTNLLSLKEVIDLGGLFGLSNKDEVLQVIHLFHDLGTIQYFENEYLKNKVIINPQWIVDVLSCVISVHENSVKNGKLLHHNINKVWPEHIYPSNLHNWLLRLTEEFDLSFPLKSESANLIPCLLPSIDFQNIWEGDILTEQDFQTKMTYFFYYLPSGLFNRAQVRLQQYSDEGKFWKDGSFLKKNIHRGFIRRKDNSTVQVEVRGPQPENMLFVIHEVFENLIAESFVGVKYDYYLPCSECVYLRQPNPSLLPSSKIKRALTFKVPFMQCYNYFHTLSLNQIQNMLPPENSEDFDSQLQSSIRDLEKMKSSIRNNLAILYCSDDFETTNTIDKVTPTMIQEELEESEILVYVYMHI
ncbi:DgyrCDS14654 [Dimorphilus gyrociliatus]|uniref:non-specific serine/threonine protein kinase n=1 Tax=Dimorphilus gyrociliatus TaxID=2664684 RepID=A0A7I8WES8_9ANNE|nr:DgyrCDS14654 [Dimorphilus gyrociliatus]